MRSCSWIVQATERGREKKSKEEGKREPKSNGKSQENAAADRKNAERNLCAAHRRKHMAHRKAATIHRKSRTKMPVLIWIFWLRVFLSIFRSWALCVFVPFIFCLSESNAARTSSLGTRMHNNILIMFFAGFLFFSIKTSAPFNTHSHSSHN